MAKRSKALPVRKSARSRDDDAVLIRTAESLGRMIGSLQRQLQDVASQVSDDADRAFDGRPKPQLDDVFGVFGGEKKTATARQKSSASRGAGRKKTPQKSAASRKAAVATRKRRPGARRTSVRPATAGRSRSGKTSRKR